jgi:hypothetical protein
MKFIDKNPIQRDQKLNISFSKLLKFGVKQEVRVAMEYLSFQEARN